MSEPSGNCHQKRMSPPNIHVLPRAELAGWSLVTKTRHHVELIQRLRIISVHQVLYRKFQCQVAVVLVSTIEIDNRWDLRQILFDYCAGMFVLLKIRRQATSLACVFYDSAGVNALSKKRTPVSSVMYFLGSSVISPAPKWVLAMEVGWSVCCWLKESRPKAKPAS